MGFGNFVKANRTITAKWLVKNENKIRFDLSIQRGFDIWDIDRKSLFIHSLIYGYPVPNFYAQDTGDDTLWMLDGKQRFTTVIQYQKGEFALSEDVPSVNDIEIAGMKFDELPEEFQEEIRDYNFTIFAFKNMTEDERDEMFLRLNNGFPLSKIELTRVMASSKIMDFVNKITEHELFKNVISISDNQRKHYIDQEIILQTLSVLINGYTSGFSSKEIQEFALKLKEEGIPENIQKLLQQTTDYIFEAIPVKEKFMKKVNIPIIYNLAVRAQNDEIAPEKLGGFLQWFFENNKIGSVYSTASRSKSASKESIRTRIEELNKAYEENIESAPNYKQPEPKQSTSKRGRPRKEQNITTEYQPEEQISMVAAPGSLH